MKLLFSNLVFGRKRGMGESMREIEMILGKKKGLWLGEKITLHIPYALGSIFSAWRFSLVAPISINGSRTAKRLENQ